MRGRLYCLLPDLASAHATMDDLLAAGVGRNDMQFVAREDCDLSGLHAAGLLETSDLVRSAGVGLVVGAALGGLLGAAIAVRLPGPGGGPQWNLIPLLVFAIALLDAWTSSMIGISVPNKSLERFASSIAQGRILLMLDVAGPRAGDIQDRLRARHPEAQLSCLSPASSPPSARTA